VFIGTHGFGILYAVATHFGVVPEIVANTAKDVSVAHAELGWLGMFLLLLRAYSMGAGTYTGIEAVSNGLPILREPRTVTGKRTMVYMAISLAFIAGGILFGYLLLGVGPETGKTLNAVLMNRLAASWNVAGLPVGT